jgi:hypothetical protein
VKLDEFSKFPAIAGTDAFGMINPTTAIVGLDLLK